MRRYAEWESRLTLGTPEDPRRCIVAMWQGERTPLLYHQCERRRGHGPGGEYCRQHSEEADQGKYLRLGMLDNRLLIPDEERRRGLWSRRSQYTNNEFNPTGPQRRIPPFSCYWYGRRKDPWRER